MPENPTPSSQRFSHLSKDNALTRSPTARLSVGTLENAPAPVTESHNIAAPDSTGAAKSLKEAQQNARQSPALSANMRAQHPISEPLNHSAIQTAPSYSPDDSRIDSATQQQQNPSVSADKASSRRHQAVANGPNASAPQETNVSPNSQNGFVQPNVIHTYYPPMMPYVAASPMEHVTTHFMHAPAPHWVPTHAPSYTWLPMSAPLTQNASMSHHHHHSPASYQYHVPAPAVQHVAVAHPQFAHPPGTVWASVPQRAGHPAYPTPVQVHVHEFPQAHYPHYYPPPPLPPHTHPQPQPQNNVQVSVQQEALSKVGEQSGAAKSPPMDSKPIQQRMEDEAKPSATPVRDSAQCNPESKSPDLQETELNKTDDRLRSVEKMSAENGISSSLPMSLNLDQANSNPGAGNGITSVNEPVSSKKTVPKQGVQQPIRKSRKPYTITKNRESWTDKEHQLFVQALQLYNRDWKRIEAYIGTKTVLQIRSHAQKHFSKVTKYKTGEYIPPPRPKRRASRPYPRSRGATSSVKSPAIDSKIDSTQIQETAKTASDSGVEGGDENGRKVCKENGIISDGTKDPASQRTIVEKSTAQPIAVMTTQDGHRSQKQPCVSEMIPNRPPPPRLPAVPSAYTPYYYTALQPNGLSYPTSVLHPNHYSAQPIPHQHHHSNLIACNDNNCSRNRMYHGHAPSQHHLNMTHPNLNVTHNLAQQANQAQAHYYHPQASSADNKQANSDKLTPQEKYAHPQPLMVLSNCVGMMRNKESMKLEGDAAARRAHRAKVIRERKKNGKMEADERKGADEAFHGSNDERTKDQETDSKQNNREKSARLSSILNTLPGELQVTKSGANILVGPSTSASNPGLMDVGSDEAVAGFSGSDGQGSMSDGTPPGEPERSVTPEEDPNSSSGDDGRGQNTRGSSPADPNSAGSREDTPSAPDTNASRNPSPPESTPSGSRETTPTGNGGQNASAGGKCEKSRNGQMVRRSKSKANDTLMVAAKVLSKYRDSNENGRAEKTNKVGIDNLLNNSPQLSAMLDLTRASSPPSTDQKRGRSPNQGKIGNGNSKHKSGTRSYEHERESQRRRRQG